MARVMIVTNNQEVLDGLRTVLELASDMEIRAMAGSPESAIEQAAAGVDVALVDLEMPGHEGYATVRLLHRSGVKVIALTAHDYPDAREEALRYGASRVMLKGLEVAEMVRMIEEVPGC